MTTIRDLLASQKCEVLFNFMYDSVNRFITDERPETSQSFNPLFGVETIDNELATALGGAHRKQFLVDLCKKQLQAVGGFNFVHSFEMMNSARGRTQCYLMFGTRHTKGLRAMKDAMWALDPVSGVCFSGFAGDQLVLFEPEPNTEPLRAALVRRFGHQSVSIEAIDHFVIHETDYTTTHYKSVLKNLEHAGTVECISERARRGTFPAGTVLRFAPANVHCELRSN